MSARRLSFCEEDVYDIDSSDGKISLHHRQTELNVYDLQPAIRNSASYIWTQEMNDRYRWRVSNKWNFGLQQKIKANSSTESQPSLPVVSLSGLMSLRDGLHLNSVIFGLRGHDSHSVIRNLISEISKPQFPKIGKKELRMLTRDLHGACHVATTHGRPRSQSQVFEDAVESLEPSGDEEGICICVCPSEYVSSPFTVFVRLRHAVPFGLKTDIPVRFIMLELGPPETVMMQRDRAEAMGVALSDELLMTRAQLCEHPQVFLDAFDAFISEVHIVPRVDVATTQTANEGVDNIILQDMQTAIRGRQGLIMEKTEHCGAVPPFSGWHGQGIWSDVKTRYKEYWSDWKTGLNKKVVRVILFLFFACLGLAVALGGFLYSQTDSYFGVSDMLLATAAAGIIVALIGGQPMMIWGSTGPLLVFIVVLKALAEDQDWAFRDVYTWTGIWSLLFCLLIAFTDFSVLIKYCTTFTDDVFEGHITLIIMMLALKDIKGYFKIEYYDRDTALLSLTVGIATCWLCLGLRQFRFSRFLQPVVREFFSDFHIVIAMAVTAIFNEILFGSIHLRTLTATSILDRERSYLTEFWTSDGDVIMFSILPGLFLALLFYMECNAAKKAMYSRERLLKKGASYHYDMLLHGVMAAAFSICGIPWVTVSASLSLDHLEALSGYRLLPPESAGKPQRRVVYRVKENRISGLIIHILILGCVLFNPILDALRHLPVAVIDGMLLAIGVIGLMANHLTHRITLLFSKKELHSPDHVINTVSKKNLWIYVIIELLCLSFLLYVKGSKIAVVFPLLVCLLMPLRFLILPLFMSKESLNLIEGGH